MSTAGAASLAALIPARAAASRKNGAKSKGPKTPEGKARSAQNAIKHGLRADKFVVVGDEDPRAFAALERATIEELAPEGALQTLLAGRIARAAWRLQRADQIEAELFAREMYELLGKAADLGLALIRDCNGARAFNTLLRYRGAAQAELARSLRLFKALQAEAAQKAEAAARAAADRDAAAAVGESEVEMPSKPDARRIPGEAAAAAHAQGMTEGPHHRPARQAKQVTGSPQGWRAPVREGHPSEPESRRDLGDPATSVLPPTASRPGPVAA